MNQNRNRSSISRSPNNVTQIRRKPDTSQSHKFMMESKINKVAFNKEKKNRNEQKIPFIDKKKQSKFFQLFPPQFQQIDPRIIQTERQICRQDFYINQHITLRANCLQETKKIVPRSQANKDPGLFKKTFIQLWPKLLNDVKQTQNFEDNYFEKNFKCSGEQAFQLVQMDLLKLMLRKPFQKFSSAWSKIISKQAQKQYQIAFEGDEQTFPTKNLINQSSKKQQNENINQSQKRVLKQDFRKIISIEKKEQSKIPK